jgi:hypothetical protein
MPRGQNQRLGLTSPSQTAPSNKMAGARVVQPVLPGLGESQVPATVWPGGSGPVQPVAPNPCVADSFGAGLVQPFRAPLRVYDGGSDELLGVRDVARRLGVSTASVYRWAGRDTAARAAVVQHHPVSARRRGRLRRAAIAEAEPRLSSACLSDSPPLEQPRFEQTLHEPRQGCADGHGG